MLFPIGGPVTFSTGSTHTPPTPTLSRRPTPLPSFSVHCLGKDLLNESVLDELTPLFSHHLHTDTFFPPSISLAQKEIPLYQSLFIQGQFKYHCSMKFSSIPYLSPQLTAVILFSSQKILIKFLLSAINDNYTCVVSPSPIDSLPNALSCFIPQHTGR